MGSHATDFRLKYNGDLVNINKVVNFHSNHLIIQGVDKSLGDDESKRKYPVYHFNLDELDNAIEFVRMGKYLDYEVILDARGDKKYNVFLFKPELGTDGLYGGVVERFRFSKVGYFYNGVSISIIPQKADINKHKFWVTKNYYVHGYFFHSKYNHP